MEIAFYALTVGTLAGIGIIFVPMLQKIAGQVGGTLLGVVISQKHLHNMDSSRIFSTYLINHARRLGMVKESVRTERAYIRSEERNRTVFFRQNDYGWQLFLYRGWPVLFTRSATEETSYGKVWFFRKTIHWENLLLKAAEYSDDQSVSSSQSKFKVVRHTGVNSHMLQGGASSNKSATPDEVSDTPSSSESIHRPPVGWNADDLGAPIVDDLLSVLSLGSEAQRVVDAAKFWHTHKRWYNDHSVPWRRGFLLYGEPGNGKTTLVRALGQHLDLPIHVFDLGSMDNADLDKNWEESRVDGDCRIVLLEDIDAIFNKRKNVYPPSMLTFDALLNIIDGVEQENGLLLFVTTNQVESIDAALGAPIGTDGNTTRPGRIDLAIELPGLDEAGRLKMALRIVEDEVAAEKLTIDGDGDTAVKFQERCIQYALSVLWTPQGKELQVIGENRHG